VSYVRLLGSAPSLDRSFRRAPAKLPAWATGLVVLMAAAAIGVSLVLAGFGLYAALRIARGYGAAVEHTANPALPDGWNRSRSIAGDVAPRSILPPVVARSDPADVDAVQGSPTTPFETAALVPDGSAPGRDEGRTSPGSERIPAGSDVAASDPRAAAPEVAEQATLIGSTAAQETSTGGHHDHAPLAAKTSKVKRVARRTKPRVPVKRAVLEARARGVVRPQTSFGTFANPLQPVTNSQQRTANTTSPFQPMFNAP
jgi:hypothetical protein